ncbi:MAG: BamA/TamA family outer membrane protein, partial [Cyanobacteria bacterium P01_H01_bin.15]
GSGRAFLLGFAEYRFPISQFQISKFPVKLRGNLFFDAGSDLGTSADVIGEPGIARDKDATGFGYGLGLDAQIPGVALFRLSFGFNNVGEFRLLFRTGDRF